MLIFDLQIQNQQPQVNCNSGGVPITSYEAGTQPSSPFEIVYNYGTPVSIAFVPNSITNPSDCTDQYWLYQADLPAGFPDNIQISFDSKTSTIKVSQSHSETVGYQSGYLVGSYTINTYGILLVDPVFTSKYEYRVQPAFDLTLTIDCCYAPTVITTPTTTQALYSYVVGDPQLTIQLSDDWLGDNDCCRIGPAASV